MKRICMVALAALTLLLGGCATTTRSNVLAFNNWPTELKEKTFIFAYPKTPDSIEYRATENLIRQQLERIGLQPTDKASDARLIVTLDYRLDARDVRIIAPDPYWYGPGWGWPHRWGRGYWPYGPYPYGPGPMAYDDTTVHVFRRMLHLTIAPSGGGKPLYDVIVENASKIEDPNKILPILAQNAFDGFPGQNGVVRAIDVKVDE